MWSETIVYLLAGLPGSGKTEFAKRMEAEGVMRLSVDEEVYARNGRYGIDYPEQEYFQREAPALASMELRLVELINAGRSVVFDHGLWRRSERDVYKRLVTMRGAAWRLVYFKADRAVLLDRLNARNLRDEVNALTVTERALDDFIARFEEPSGEGEIVIDTGADEGAGPVWWRPSVLHGECGEP